MQRDAVLMLAGLRERFAARVPKGRVARGILTLASGTVIAQIITVCAMPLVTRLYTPAQIGVISLFLSFFSFWAATLSLRYEYALLIAKDDRESHAVKYLALIVVVVMSGLGAPILWSLNRTQVLGFDILPAWAPLVAIPTLLGYGFFLVYRSWALRAGLIKAVTAATIARSGAYSGLQVILGAFALGVPGLFAAHVTGSWAAILKLFKRVHKHYLPSRPVHLAGSDLLATARTFWKFAIFETPSTWVDQLALTLPVPLIAALHGATAAGWFGLARMIVTVPNSQIGSAVGDVFQMELASAVVARDSARAHRLFYRLLLKLALFGLPLFVAIAVLGPLLVPWIFGGEWREAGIAAAAVAPWLYAAFTVSPLSRVLSVLQAQQYKLIYDICAVLLLVTAFFVSKVHHYSFINSILTISAAGVLSYLVYAAVLIAVIELHLKKAVA